MAEGTTGRRPKWEFDREAFDALLSRLDPDPSTAGEHYEVLHRKLVKFFEWRGGASPEDLADATIDRVARRVVAGDAINKVPAFALGVARLVALETLKNAGRDRELDDRMVAPTAVEEDEVDAKRCACLDSCLAALPDEQRQLVLEYFAADKRAKIEGRRELAARLGVEMNALRIRVHRIRGKLEQCVRECVARRGAG